MCARHGQQVRKVPNFPKGERRSPHEYKARVNSKKGRAFKVKRSSAVEPVFGTLTEFLAMRKVNTRGISNANKGMLMAAMAYNLKKYLKFSQKRVETVATSAEKHLPGRQAGLLEFLAQVRVILKLNAELKF